MLSFLSPLFLAGAAVAAVPILLHLLKRQPEVRVKFPAVKLLKGAPVEHTDRRRIRELLLLALRVAALVLLAVAFARPFMASGAALTGAGVTVVALDRSYSMSAPGRFERARDLARRAIESAPSGDLVAVVAFADTADVLEKPTSDRVLAAAAIDRSNAGFGATRYRAALATAAGLLEGRRGTIVVVTDLQENGWDAGDRAALPETARISVADVGPLPADLAVTNLQAAPGRVVATVRNSGDRAADARVHLTADGGPSGEASVAVGPHSAVDVSLAVAGQPSAVSAAVEDRDGLQANNVRYAVLGGAGRPTLLVVTGTGDLQREAFYLRAALEAGAPGLPGYDVQAVSAAKLGDVAPPKLSAYAAVVLVSTTGLERRGREQLVRYIEQGGGLLLATGPEIDGEVAGSLLGDLDLRVSSDLRPAPRTLAAADRRHPVFAKFGADVPTLALVQFQLVSRIAADGCQTIARFTTGESALLDCPVGQGRAVVLASDLNNAWNDFPLHATFVPFVQEVVRYASGGRARTAEYTIADAPAAAEGRPGVVPMADAGGRTTRVAVNVDPRESDPARMSPAEFESVVIRLKEDGASALRVEARQQEERQRLWRYAIMLVLAALAAEATMASRTA